MAIVPNNMEPHQWRILYTPGLNVRKSIAYQYVTGFRFTSVILLVKEGRMVYLFFEDIYGEDRKLREQFFTGK